ncbi:MAG: tRNA (adenosine(37)-N6)-threonylcarbamoyltransferase complex ATPase subunit type 1 TsaE [Verrucomicrobia bacterium]|nr:tRNA (adenosine(37)-N6)-threonylcarbamoyltransferase complex ATPase subunit type 1 TsaE [Verrucomicrobiota bacterium]
MATLTSRSPEETLALGEAWGRAATRGLVIGLSGELGAGKTQLVKGVARGLGITARVTSPSFALVNVYREGRLPLFHLDLYRLDTPEQIIAAGLEEYLFNPDGVAVVEWIERWTGGQVQSSRFKVQSGGGRFRRVVIEAVSETERRISYEDSGT